MSIVVTDPQAAKPIEEAKADPLTNTAPIAQIQTNPLAPKPAERGKERRAFPRRRAKGAAGYRKSLFRLGRFAQAKLLDICQDGVGMLVKEPLKPNDLIEVEMTSPLGRRGIVIEAEVRWLEP